MSAVGNVLRGGLSTRPDIAFLTIGGVGDLRYHGRDNIAVDRQGRPVPMFGRYTTSPARIIEVARPAIWPAGLPVLPANQVETHVLRHAGARPWDRDPHDIRVIFDVVEGRGEIIDDERQVGGYPQVDAGPRALRRGGVGPGDDGAALRPLSGPARRFHPAADHGAGHGDAAGAALAGMGTVTSAAPSEPEDARA